MRAPRPRPAAGATLPASTPSFLCLAGAYSAAAAVNALTAAPVAMPWTVRAAITQPMFGASRNISMAAASTPRAPMSTGRRPM